jgi:tRNA (guanine-N7-)-methyltransferase
LQERIGWKRSDSNISGSKGLTRRTQRGFIEAVSSGQAQATPALASFIYRPLSYVERIDPAELFPQSQPLEVELGSGDGSFLALWAARHPNHNFLGVERLLGRLRKLDRKGRRAGLTNLRLLRIEAAYLLEYLLPRGSVHALHLYFPDPWPKRKHRLKRLVNARFAEVAALALAPGGTIYLRTDDEDYFAQMICAFETNAKYRSVETPAELRAALTDFEREFESRGVATLRAAFRLESKGLDRV